MNPEKLRTTIPAEETPIDEGKSVEYLDNVEEEADPDTVRKRGEKAIRTAEIFPYSRAIPRFSSR